MTRAGIGRIVHITQPKSGSQWVRDVLTAPEVWPLTRYPDAGCPSNAARLGTLEVPDGTFAGPLYDMNLWEWFGWRSDADRAIVVVRDPRDVIVSLLHSILYSHSKDAEVAGISVGTTRQHLLSMDENSERVAYLVDRVAPDMVAWYSTWAHADAPSARVVRYEDLLANQLREFTEIVRWLEWDVPAAVLETVVSRLSFERRSGRKPGDTDKFSHYRKGVAGDWKNFFSRTNARKLNELYSGPLVKFGYEQNADWWCDLPEAMRPTAAAPDAGSPDAVNRELLEVLDRRNTFLEEELRAKEQTISELAKAAQERLDGMQALSVALAAAEAKAAAEQQVQPSLDEAAAGADLSKAEVSAAPIAAAGVSGAETALPEGQDDLAAQSIARSESGEAGVVEKATAGDVSLEKLTSVVQQLEDTQRQLLLSLQFSDKESGAVADPYFSNWSRADFVGAILEKERIIVGLSAALRAHREGRLVRRLSTALRSRLNAVSLRLRPRLGMLHQHPPRYLRRLESPSLKLVQELPSIAIVTPSFQQGRFIEQTLRSVLDQNYPKLSYYVQDGGSTDETVDVLQSYSHRLTGWESAPDNGQTQAINRGIAKVDGEVLAYLNSDDLLLPGALHIVGQFFAAHPDVDVVYGDRLIIDENGQEIGNWRLPKHDDAVLSWADYIPQETLFWRRSAWLKVGACFDESFRFAMDWDLIVRLRDSGARFAHIPRFLGAFRVHSEQKTSSVITTVGSDEMMRIRTRALGFQPSHLEIRSAIARYLLAHMLVDIPKRVGDKISRRRDAKLASPPQ